MGWNLFSNPPTYYYDVYIISCQFWPARADREKFMRKILFISLLFLLLFFHPPSTIAQTTTSPTLIFSLDQSFGNGIIHQQDIVGLNRIILTLKIFQKYYPTYALLNPMNLDPKKLETVLDLFEQNSIPFVLDVYASDTLGIGAGNPSVANPYDLSHGIPLSNDQLTNYRNRYTSFKGIRIFEVFGSDFTHRACRTTSPEWCEPRWFSQAANPFFDANIARRFVKFAKENNLFVIWSDLHWYEFSAWDPIQQTYEQQMAQIMSDYPSVVTPMYNNNIPDGQSQGHLNIWHTAINKFSSGAGIGLSDQAWLHDRDHMNTPISELIAWANSARDKGAKFIEFEPVWYFFSFPEGIVWDPNNYTTDPKMDKQRLSYQQTY